MWCPQNSGWTQEQCTMANAAYKILAEQAPHSIKRNVTMIAVAMSSLLDGYWNYGVVTTPAQLVDLARLEPMYGQHQFLWSISRASEKA